MKILILVPNLLIGGVQTFAVDLAISLANKGNEIHLTSFSNEIDQKYESVLNKSPVIYFSLNKKPGFSFKFINDLNLYISNLNPDLVNTHSSRTIRYVFLTKAVKKIPVIHTITNNPKIYNKKLFLFYKLNLKRKLRLKFVGISDLVSKTFVEVYKCDHKRITTIYNGIPICDEEKILSESKKYDLFFCGSLSEIKRPFLLIESFAKAKNKKLTLLIAGSGNLFDNTVKLASDLGVSDRVTFLGAVANPLEYCLKSRYFINTSISEGNPISVLEAMSAGLPVIAPKVGGIPDLIDDGVNGYLFNPSANSEEIAGVIDFVASLSKMDLAIIANNNRKKSLKWDISKISDEYMNLFKGFIDGK